MLKYYGCEGFNVSVGHNMTPAQQICIFCGDKYGRLMDRTNADCSYMDGGIILKIVCPICVHENSILLEDLKNKITLEEETW